MFNAKGELLLKKGKVITTEHQLNVLLNNGYFMDKKVARNVVSHTPSSSYNDETTESIFDIKERWIAELYSLL